MGNKFARLLQCWLIILIPMSIILVAATFIIGPLMAYLLHGIPYELPTLSALKKMLKIDIFSTVFMGIVIWVSNEFPFNKNNKK